MLIAPVSLCFSKVGPLLGLRRWVCDLSDQEGSRSFSNAIDENTEERDLEENKETNSEAEQNAFAIVEPGLLLLRGKPDTGKVGLELRYVLAPSVYYGFRLNVPILSSNF
jgi:hypothetical protein